MISLLDIFKMYFEIGTRFGILKSSSAFQLKETQMNIFYHFLTKGWLEMHLAYLKILLIFIELRLKKKVLEINHILLVRCRNQEGKNKRIARPTQKSI